MTFRLFHRGLASFLLLAAVASAANETTLTRFGITWTLEGEPERGEFANGDPWVVGPVRLLAIEPGTIEVDGATLHGSMINPEVNGPQAYDSRIRNNTFDPELNVAQRLPLVVPPGSSLLSAISRPEKLPGDKAQLETIAILTVLDEAPPPGSFRPPYVGADKEVRWSKRQLDYRRLGSFPRVPGAPSPAAIEGAFERPWIEQKTNWTGRYLHPRANQPAYGRELARRLADGLLTLQLDYPDAEKETLLIRLVQYGIDIYGAARAGAKWNADGGHNQGRKMPLLLAGAVLGDEQILEYGDARRHFIFQEDQQTFYVSLSDVGRPLYTKDKRPREPYRLSDVGLAEWGEKHHLNPARDGRNWDSYYRNVSGAPTFSHVLAARLMGLEQRWNWPPVFDYYERYWTREKDRAGQGQNMISTFAADLWRAAQTEHLAEHR